MEIKIAIVICGVALILTAGCSRQEATGEIMPAAAEQSAPATSSPTPTIPEDAPVLADVYPTLSAGALRYARLVDLPSGTLLQAEGLSITDSDLDAELAQTPSHLRDQLRKHAFILLEQHATRGMVVALARRQTGDVTGDEERLLQRYFEALTRDTTVGEDEIAAFYEENREMMGGAALAEIAPRIREHVRAQKQQVLVEAHIRDLARDIPVAVAADWVETQAATMLDNPLDRGRASGRPTLASFGADSCIPCQMMKPVRESIEQKYGDHLNVVYVHADRDQILASRYGIRGIPHMIFFDANGTEVHAQTGMMDEEQIEAILARSGVTL